MNNSFSDNTQNMKEIFGSSLFGYNELVKVFGQNALTAVIEPCLLTESEMILCKKSGYNLLYVPELLFGNPITPEHLVHHSRRLFPQLQLLYDGDNQYKWYISNKHSFYYTERVPSGWYCLSSYPDDVFYFLSYYKQEKLCHSRNNTIIGKLTAGIFSKKPKTFLKYCIDRLVSFFGDEVICAGKSQEISRSSVTMELLRLIISHGLSRKSFLQEEYIWTSTSEDVNGMEELREFVRIGRYGVDGLDITKRDRTDGNSMTSCIPCFKVS